MLDTFFPASAIVCGAPSFSCGVIVELFSSTINNSEIFYQCQPGFLPEGRRILLCGEDGRWSPDPQGLCIGKQACKRLFCLYFHCSVLFDSYSYSRQKSVYGCYCCHYSCCLLTGDIHYWDCVWCSSHCLHQQVEQEGT